jgi:replication factor C subunit 1
MSRCNHPLLPTLIHQGLTFVFTGVLDSIDRDDAVNLVKRYGGKVTTAPSRNTSYVILGNEAGPKKLELIKKNNLKTINEDGLFQLIRTLPAYGGASKAGQQAAAKRQAEEKKVMEMAKEMEVEGKKQAAAAVAKGLTVQPQLWTKRYAPTNKKEIVGNKGLVEKLEKWLHDWYCRLFLRADGRPMNVKANFKKPGESGMGLYRAVCISGPPGIGKTTAAHLVAKLQGYDILEYNASDTRNEKLLRVFLLFVLSYFQEKLAGVTDNTSIFGYMKQNVCLFFFSGLT